MAELLEAYESEIARLTLVPSEGGVFEVVVDGELVFSRRALRRHAEPGEIVRLIGERLAPAEP